MTVAIDALGYKKLSRIIFEWQAADRTALLAFFMMIETLLHWVWCFFVWRQQDVLDDYVNTHLLYPLWIGVTLIGLFFWWISKHISHIRNEVNFKDTDLYKWQLILMVTYTLYIAIAVVMMGYSSLVAGVSLVGGTMLGMLLIRRRYVWRAFLIQILIILLAISAPFMGVNLPNMRQLTVAYPLLDNYSYLTYNEVMVIENAITASTFKNDAVGLSDANDIQRASTLFWRVSHSYLALPKAIFIVYMFRMLLKILDDSKAKIVEHANKDELTGLSNRRHGLMQMEHSLMVTKEAQEFSLILLDLDWFKTVNDTYGHEMGDQVLRNISKILTTSLPSDAIVSRYGGEEFLIVLANTPHNQAMIMAEQLRKRIGANVIAASETKDCRVNASLGLYTITHNEIVSLKQDANAQIHAQVQTLQKTTGTTPFKKKYKSKKLTLMSSQVLGDICQYLISVADAALYEAKKQGRDRVVSANQLPAEALSEKRYNA